MQGDPFASPSKVSVAIDGQLARFPKQLFDKKYKRIALQDYLTRVFYQKIERFNFKAKVRGKVVCYLSAGADRRFWNGQPATIDPAMVTCLCVWK